MSVSSITATQAGTVLPPPGPAKASDSTVPGSTNPQDKITLSPQAQALLKSDADGTGKDAPHDGDAS
jgi:hypothetical protein